jgi:hypothetical protein
VCGVDLGSVAKSSAGPPEVYLPPLMRHGDLVSMALRKAADRRPGAEVEKGV